MITPLNQQLTPLARRSRRLSAAFSPASISGLVLWLDGADAATITTVSGFVSQWSDKSGHGFHATQATSANRPQYLSTGGINGIGSVYMNTTTSAMGFFNLAANPLSGATGATGFVVAANDSEGSQSGAPFEQWGSSGQYSHHPFISVIYSDFCSTTRFGAISFTAGSLITPNCYTLASGPTEWSIAQGGTSLYSTSSNTFAPSYGTIGSSITAAPWLGKIGEQLVYNRVLNSTERAQLRSYASSKWGTP